VVGSIGAMIFGFRVARRYALLARQREEELELFAARVAHDIRGPLTPALYALSAVARNPDEGLCKLGQRGTRSLERVLDVVNDLFSFAMGNASPTPGARASVKAAVDGVVSETESLALEHETSIVVAPFDESLEVACAPGVLTSVISNLVRNAVNYIGESAARRVTVRVCESGGTVMLEVIDTGPGLPPEDQARIFEPYVRGAKAKTGGLGLGLATEKRLVDAHGGKVGVRSAEARGSIFWVELPRAR
jgi:signal transduction histidine kinase